MFRFFLLIPALIVLAWPASAVRTRIWQQADSADFEKGNIRNLSIRSDGRLSLAPVFRELLDSSSTYLWALAQDSRGNLYAGGGGPGGSGATLYVRPAGGEFRALAELDGLEIHAIAIDRQDRVHVATFPDGKVYRVSEGGAINLFFDPRTEYIWAMAFNSRGDLFVATGSSGQVYRVTPEGRSQVFFETEEIHARSLAVDAGDNLVVGTEPGGLVFRISPGGEGFVLYQAGKREITAVAHGPDGSIYAAGVGDKQPVAAPPPQPVTPAPKPLAPAITPQAAQQPAAPPPSIAAPLPVVSGGSEIYRIAGDGFPQRIWSHPRDIVYAIGFDREGRPLAATGNGGVVYRIDDDQLHTVLFSAPPSQVTGFCAGRNGEIYVTTGNIGQVYQIGPELEGEGWIESDVFDAELFSLWGRLSYRGGANGGSVRFETRSGNMERPRRDWSGWTPVEEKDGSRIQSTGARFLQWKLTMTASPEGRSPEVQSVDVAFLPKNVAPVVERIEITPPNYRFPQPAVSAATTPQPITLPPISTRRRTPSPPQAIDTSIAMQYARGHIGARWAAKDDNGDSLVFKVEIRGVNESEWKPLRDGLSESYVSWDSTALPDGEYLLRVTASDEPDNPPAQALSDRLVSDPFLIDNTPPAVSEVAYARRNGKLEVRWTAKDAHSVIRRAEYSVDGGEWLVVPPTTRLSDSREHDYVLVLDDGASRERTIAVRVSDDYDNQAVEKVIVRPAGS